MERYKDTIDDLTSNVQNPIGMEYQKLGLTSIEVSRIGFGCWAMGGHGYGNVDDKESGRAIRKALDCGVNFFDTADVYGFGHSEEVLGKALGSQRNNVIIATKFGVAWDDNGNVYKDCSVKRVIIALEGSLRRLKIDCIPLYQIHWHDGKTPMEEVMEALLKCREAGKILHIGCCNFSKDLLFKASNNERVELHQCPYNVATRENEGIIKYSSEKLRVSVIAYNVIGRGLFSGKYNIKRQFTENDTRTKDPDFQGSKYNRNILIAEKLSEIGKKKGKSPAQVAIRWALENPHVTCALTGIRNRQQTIENVGAIGWALDQDDKEQINSLTN